MKGIIIRGYHHTDSDALYAVGGGNTGHASSLTNIIFLSYTALTRSTDNVNFCRISLTTPYVFTVGNVVEHFKQVVVAVRSPKINGRVLAS